MQQAFIGSDGMGGNLGSLFEALAKAQSEIPKIIKSKVNEVFGSTYVPLPDLIEQVTPYLTKNGLTVIQANDGNAVKTILGHKDGGYVVSVTPLLYEVTNMNGFGSANTYARRYAYASITGVVIDDDDDGAGAGVQNTSNAQSHQAAQPQVVQAATDDQMQTYLNTIKSGDAKTLARAKAAVSSVLSGEQLEIILKAIAAREAELSQAS